MEIGNDACITGLGFKVGPRLRELVPRCQREPGRGIHATYRPLLSPSLHVAGIMFSKNLHFRVQSMAKRLILGCVITHPDAVASHAT